MTESDEGATPAPVIVPTIASESPARIGTLGLAAPRSQSRTVFFPLHCYP
jgi:hypothetical protein